MKIYKMFFTLLMLVIPFGVSAASGDVESWIKKVQWVDQGFGTITEEKTRGYIEEAKAHAKKGVSDPLFWYFYGRVTSISQGHYHRKLLKEGKTYRLDAPENQALIKEYQSYYRKALDLDDDPDSPTHLTVDMLAPISDDVLAEPDIKARALKKELELSKSGGYNSENPNYEWATYEFLLGTHSESGDMDAYLKTLNEMIERFPGHSRSQELLEAKRQAEKAIEKRDREAALEGSDVVVEQAAVKAKAVAEGKPSQPAQGRLGVRA